MGVCIICVCAGEVGCGGGVCAEARGGGCSGGAWLVSAHQQELAMRRGRARTTYGTADDADVAFARELEDLAPGGG